MLNLKDLTDITVTIEVDTESIIKLVAAGLVLIIFAGVFGKVVNKLN